jgi:uncharacterized protein YjbJ (UPF0337 family)
MGAAGHASPDSGQGAAEQAKEKAGEVAGQAQEKAGEVAGQAQQKAQQAAEQAKSRVQEMIDQRSTEVGEEVVTTADALRSVAEQLRDQGKDAPARIVEQAADRAQRLGGRLRDADADELLSEIEDIARRQPWVVVAGGIVLGFAAARFLKASSSRRYGQRQTSLVQTNGGGGDAGEPSGASDYGGTVGTTEGIGAGGGRFVRPGTPAPATTASAPAPSTAGLGD